MNTPNGPDLTVRLEEAIAFAEDDVRRALEAATESDTWTLGDYLSEQKFTAAGACVDRVKDLATIEFHARAIAWAELVAVRDGTGSVDSKCEEAPTLTFADLEKEFPLIGIDEITEELFDPDEVGRDRLYQCHHVLELQLSCLWRQGGHLTWAASTGSAGQVMEALSAIDRTASAMTRTYGLWMRHLGQVWSPQSPVDPDDVDAAYGHPNAFTAYRNAE
ncbi:hypothetical protein [Glycomyces paridis]|uniref:Uncharacterized protein n=1 Tax=Glycomyces paridis TaxID=2126555 RepID=A0A4S8P0K5_9ACTN|nr:hypothetical protein [Glycomyces paridis]THV22102.1 hypothetical protein E9998_24090 [Glycomyces paridis]